MYRRPDTPGSDLVRAAERRGAADAAEAAYGYSSAPDLGGVTTESTPGGVVGSPWLPVEVWGIVLPGATSDPANGRYAWAEAVKPTRDLPFDTDGGRLSGTKDLLPFVPTNPADVLQPVPTYRGVLQPGLTYRGVLNERGTHYDVETPAGANHVVLTTSISARSGSTVHRGECTVYDVEDPTEPDTLVSQGFTILVYNLMGIDVPGGIYAVAHRNAFGNWYFGPPLLFTTCPPVPPPGPSGATLFLG